MALQFSLTTEQGATYATAYCRVVNYSADINNVSISTVTHVDSTARTDNKLAVDSRSFAVTAPDPSTLSETDMIAWCYNQIKADSHFSGSTDV